MRLLHFCVAIVALTAFLFTNTYAQFSANGEHARLADGTNAEANGGGDSSLIGINTAGINNWGINQWDLSSIQGRVVTEVTLTFAVNAGFANANHGSALDTISIHEMYSTNAGWLEGGQLANASNEETMGSATFNFQAQDSATLGTPWQDASGADVANFLGAFDATPIDTVAGYAVGEGPTTIEFVVPIATAQRWVDDPAAFAGIVLSASDVDGDSRSRFNFFSNPAVLSINVGSILLGDVNMDGAVDFLDISPFIASLSAAGTQPEADINQDSVVDFLDISPFILLLASP